MREIEIWDEDERCTPPRGGGLKHGCQEGPGEGGW